MKTKKGVSPIPGVLTTIKRLMSKVLWTDTDQTSLQKDVPDRNEMRNYHFSSFYSCTGRLFGIV